MNEIFAKGEWWLPQTPNEKVSGDLTFSQKDGARLELRGMFSELHDFGPPIPLILGADTDGRIYTLRSSLMVGATHLLIATSEFKPHVIFEGIQAESEDELAFDAMIADLTYLFDWAGTLGVNFETPSKEVARLTYAQPADIDIEISSALVSIAFSAGFKHRWDESSIKQSVTFYVKPQKRIGYDAFVQEFAFYLLNFINFASGLTNCFRSLRFNVLGDNPKIVTCYYQQVGFIEKKKDLTGPTMLLSLESAGDNITSIISNWFAFAQTMPAVLALFFRDRSHESITLEVRLLTLAQALEKFHRDKSSDALVEKTVYNSVKRRMLKQCPSTLRAIFVNSLAHGNKKSLRERLTELAMPRQDLLRPLVGNVKAFVACATDSRNYYTHFEERLAIRKLEPHALLCLIDVLSILLESCILAEIGVPVEEHVRLFNSYSKYQRAMHGSEALKHALANVYGATV